MENKITLKIQSVAFGAKGISRIDGKVYFVNDAVEEDIVKVEITEQKKKYCTANIIEFIQKSPLRFEQKFCQFFQNCGGCQWLDIEYKKQIEWKKNFVLSALSRIGKIQNNIDIEIYKASQTTYYRSRVLLRVHITNGKVQLGYFKKNTRELVSINHCAVAKPSINYFITQFLQKDFSHIENQKFRLEIQDIPYFNNQTNGKIIVGLYPASPDVVNVNNIIDIIKTIDNVLWAGSITVKSNQKFIFEYEKYDDFIFFAMPFQFQQVNTEQNIKLREYVIQKIVSLKPKKVLDAFCGGGNLSLPLCKKGIYCEGVEINKNAIEACKHSIKFNNVSQNATYLCSDALSHLWKCAKKNESFDIIIADPPREGMYEHIIPISIIKPSKIIYVSCDPITLARDIGALIKKGFSLESLCIFDFFPNTYHVETVAVLKL